MLIAKPLRRRDWGLACAGLLGGLQAAIAAPGTPPDRMLWPQQVDLLDAPAQSAERLSSSPTVLVFFSIDCPYCRRHNQRLNILAQKVQGLRVLGAALDSDLGALRQYRDTQGLRFAIAPDAQVLRERVTPRRVIPFTAAIASGGEFLERIPGEMSESDVLGLARWAVKGV